jgi:hypothetical protein
MDWLKDACKITDEKTLKKQQMAIQKTPTPAQSKSKRNPGTIYQISKNQIQK